MMCVLKKLSLPFACLVLSFSSGLAHAADSPSFDCKKASSSVEKAICGDPKLMALDVDLAASYKKLRAERYPRALNPWLVSTQRDWLKMRKSCPLNGMQVCLIDSYSKRLFELELTESYVNRSWGDNMHERRWYRQCSTRSNCSIWLVTTSEVSLAIGNG